MRGLEILVELEFFFYTPDGLEWERQRIRNL